MKILTTPCPLPRCIEAINFGGLTYCIEAEADYTDNALPQELQTFFATRQPSQDDALIAQFEAEREAKLRAEWEAFKARQGQPIYKAAAVKIAAEKLGMFDTIETAIMALVEKIGDKEIYVWWNETDAISRGDAQWQQIEPVVPWAKVSAADVFDLAAQV